MRTPPALRHLSLRAKLIAIFIAIKVVPLVLLAVFVGLLRRHVQRPLRSLAGFLDELKAEQEKLKQRIAALESIVTDKSYQLKDQINRL